MTISTVFIANRGEAALRIVRACRDLGLTSVVGYSEPDRDSLAVRLADEGYCLGPGPPNRSYLHIPTVLQACVAVGADAVHPGWGFLSENADFAELCEQIGLAFVGPPSPVMRRLSDKIEARALAVQAGLRVAPGSGALPDLAAALELAEQLGYPLMLKAAAGGGGRGLAVIHSEQDLRASFGRVRGEAESLFLDGRIFLESLVTAARHVEVQILADGHGNVVHLGERDCSVQRRHQKLVEESPCQLLPDQVREQVCAAAVAAARLAGYRSAGTFEFLLDADGDCIFIEANTRLQVEHGVSEIRTGIDLAAWMLRIAAGEKLDFGQQDVLARGHAIECRLSAEDVDRGWAPAPGAVGRLVLPAGTGIRVDSDLTAGSMISPFYDPLIAKVIALGRDRTHALALMRRALAEFVCEGVATSTGFHQALFDHEVFVADRHTTNFTEQFLTQS